MAAVITHGGPDRRMQPCLCHTCREVHLCTPDFDFFTDAADHFGPLYCQACFMARHRIDCLIDATTATQPPNLERN